MKYLDFFKDLRFYESSQEMILKDMIWIASWLLGILKEVIHTDSSRGTASAFFIFGLSLLLEFFPKRKSEKTVIRLLRVILITVIIIVVMTSLYGLVDSEMWGKLSGPSFCCTIIIMIYIVIDFLITMMLPSDEDTEKKNKSIEEVVFLQRLQTGYLKENQNMGTDENE